MKFGDARSGWGIALMAEGIWIKLSHEGQLLTRHFPNEYPSYQSRVKALIPFLL
jgi:protein-S-isoprenylcysteine O-methyltransferase Ste14